MTLANPLDVFLSWYEEAKCGAPIDPRYHRPGYSNARRTAFCSHGAVSRPARRGLFILHQLPEPEKCGTFGEFFRSDRVLLGASGEAGSHRRCGRTSVG